MIGLFQPENAEPAAFCRQRRIFQQFNDLIFHIIGLCRFQHREVGKISRLKLHAVAAGSAGFALPGGEAVQRLGEGGAFLFQRGFVTVDQIGMAHMAAYNIVTQKIHHNSVSSSRRMASKTSSSEASPSTTTILGSFSASVRKP